MLGNGSPSPRHLCLLSQGDECGRCLRYRASSECSDRPIRSMAVFIQVPLLSVWSICHFIGFVRPPTALCCQFGSTHIPAPSPFLVAYALQIHRCMFRRSRKRTLYCRERSRNPATSVVLFRASSVENANWY